LRLRRSRWRLRLRRGRGRCFSKTTSNFIWTYPSLFYLTSTVTSISIDYIAIITKLSEIGFINTISTICNSYYYGTYWLLISYWVTLPTFLYQTSYTSSLISIIALFYKTWVVLTKYRITECVCWNRNWFIYAITANWRIYLKFNTVR
jgi:hypothetical protein